MPLEAHPHQDLTYRIIGAAMEVHKTLGCGFQEAVYQRALALEMTMRRLEYSREHDMPIYYKGAEVGKRRVDFLVEDVVVVEIKALTDLESVHIAQAVNYLEAFGLPVGLLLNFGAPSLQHRRVLHPRDWPNRAAPLPAEGIV
ncbi:MAG TPA: GxxExxY protein [Chthonomonadaceae bacterium]|nr:GxxExxY protein [Chthonomonadaceae bacterium]